MFYLCNRHTHTCTHARSSPLHAGKSRPLPLADLEKVVKRDHARQ